MLKIKRNIKTQKEESESKRGSLSIKRAQTSNEQNSPTTTQSRFSDDFIEWIEQNLLDRVIDNIKEYEFLKVYSQSEWGENLSNEEFIQNLIKAFFTKEDLALFRESIEALIAKDESFEALKERLNSLEAELKSLKEQNQKLKSSTVDKAKSINLILKDYTGAVKEILLEEAKEVGTGEFLITFSSSFRDILTTKELIKSQSEDERLEIIYQVSSKLLKSISGVYIASRKRLLALVAEELTSWFENYKFISAEDYSLVDSKVHNIIVKEGQKIKEAWSFCVVKKESLQTIKYADVVTF